MAQNTQTRQAETIDFAREFLREDYDKMADEIEVELQTLTKEQALRIEIDSGLENALQEMQSLQAQLPKEQMNSLFDQVSKNAVDAVVGHFGLAAAVLGSKNGGNVTTGNNFEKSIVANQADKEKWEAYNNKQKQGGFQRNDGVCDYDKGKDMIRDSSPSEVHSEYTGETMERGRGTGKAQLDHVISVKELDSNPEAHLFLSAEERATLANLPENLQWLESSANASKSDKNLMEWGREIDKETGKTNFEKYGIDEKQAQQIQDKAQKAQNSAIFKNKMKKYSSELLVTGGIDAGKMAIHSAIGVILKEFIEGMSIELKILFKEFGNESLKDIFKRFAERLKKIWATLREKWKEIIAGSFEAGIVAFFSNLVVFAINIVFTTLKKFVQIIRAGFASLCQAVKKIFDKNTPQNERLFEASKILITGIISAVTMLSAEAITKFLMTIPGLNAILGFPLPFSSVDDEGKPVTNIGDALGLCISAALGAVLSTIAIYYMDKWANDRKIAGLKLQIMTKSGEVANLKIMQTWFAFKDGFDYIAVEADRFGHSISHTTLAIAQSGASVDKELDSLDESLKELENLTKGE
ncbi:hypothetical protein [Helicobacter sp. T3_23-1056]